MNDAYDTHYTYYVPIYNPIEKQNSFAAGSLGPGSIFVMPDNVSVPEPQWLHQTDNTLLAVYEERDFLRKKLEAVLDFLVDSGMNRDDVIDHFGLEDYYVK